MCGFTMYGVMRKNFHILKTIYDGRLAIIQHDHHAHSTLQAPCSVDWSRIFYFQCSRNNALVYDILLIYYRSGMGRSMFLVQERLAMQFNCQEKLYLTFGPLPSVKRWIRLCYATKFTSFWYHYFVMAHESKNCYLLSWNTMLMAFICQTVFHYSSVFH